PDIHFSFSGKDLAFPHIQTRELKMKRRIVAAALAAIVLIQPVAAFAQCTIYEHRDFGGSSMTLGHGDTLFMKNNPNPGYSSTTNGHGFENFYSRWWNDKVSSFRV